MAHRIVGLDIGTSALRAVELLIDGDSPPVLEAFGQVGLPAGAVVGGEVKDRSLVTAALKRLWREGGFKDHRVHIGVAGLRAITREMELPPLPPDELDAAVRLQADDVLPFPMDQTSISSTVIARTTDSEGLPQIRVMVAAAHRDVIDSVVAAVEDAGLQPVEVDLDTAALSRAFVTPGSGDISEAIVSVGAGVTLVVIHRGGALQFVRTIDLGGDTVTRAVAGALDLPLLDVEAVKRGLGTTAQTDEAAMDAVSSVVDEMVAEIHNSIRYYSSLPGRETPTRVLMTGGGIQTLGLLPKLHQGLEMPVEEALPLSYVDASRLGIAADEAAVINHTVAVPIGLALDGPMRTHFDLLPKEVTSRHAENRIRRVLVFLGVVLVVLLGIGTAWRILAVRTAENSVSSLKTLATTLSTKQIPKYDQSVQLANQVTTLQQQLKPLVAKETDWLVVLNQLGQYIPKTAVFSGLNLTSLYPAAGGSPSGSSASSTASSSASGPEIIATGSTGVTTQTLTQVTQFGHTMALAPGLAEVAISGSVSQSTKAVGFSISFQITSAAHGQRTSKFTQPVP